MKKLFSLTGLILVACTVYGQGLKLGVAVEPGVSWVSAEARNVDNDNQRLSFCGGLVLDNYFQTNYAFSTGLFLGVQGGSLKYGDSTQIHVYNDVQTLVPGSTVTYKLQYLTVPLGIKLRTNEIGYFSYFAQLGVTTQINVKAKADASSEQLDDDSIKDEINFFNMGYHFGGGVEYSISTDSAIVLAIYYHNGFTDITSNNDIRVMNRLLSVRLGVMF